MYGELNSANRISEIIREKKYQSRAFLLLPMTFNIGVIVGPIFGGLLSDPAGSYPALFGKVEFLKRYPYATPNLVSACFLTSAALGVWLLLDETHEALRDQPGGDLGRRVGRKLWDWLRLRFQGSLSGSQVEYRRLGDDEDNDLDDDARVLLSPDATMSPLSPQGMASNPFTPVSPQTESQPTVPPSMKTRRPRYTQRLPFRRIFTRNVVATLAAHVLLALHLGTMNTLWFVFLSTPVWDPPTRNPAPNLPSTWHPRPPFVFTGGLGLPPRLVGLAMALLGILGITLQLLLYPRVSARLGTVTSWRLVLALCFPAVYILAPFLALVPSASPPPAPKDGAPIWLALCGILALHTLGRTFALPAQTILVNNCAPHPSVLGTVHGMAQSVSSFARTVGPMGGAWLYGEGLRRGMVGAVWWGLLAVAAIAGAVECWWVREGDGHEIWLEGDVDEDGVDDAVVEQVEVEDMERGVAGGEVGSGRAVGR